jgi:hypothetical protein
MKTSIANCRLQISKCKLNIEVQSERGYRMLFRNGVNFEICTLHFEI